MYVRCASSPGANAEQQGMTQPAFPSMPALRLGTNCTQNKGRSLHLAGRDGHRTHKGARAAEPSGASPPAIGAVRRAGHHRAPTNPQRKEQVCCVNFVLEERHKTIGMSSAGQRGRPAPLSRASATPGPPRRPSPGHPSRPVRGLKE